MKQLTDTNPVARVLGWLARAVLHHRRLVLYSQVLLGAACILFTVKNVKFDLRRDNLVGANKKYHRNFLRLKEEFPTQDDLVVVVESENPEKNRQFVERLGAKMEAETNLFKDLFYKGDLKMLGAKALLYVPESDLADLKQTLADYRPFIGQFTGATNLVSLFAMINTQFRTAKREKNAENESLMRALPALERIVSQARDSLLRSGTPPSPGVTALFNPSDDPEHDVYITFAKGRIYLITAQAPTEDLNDDAVERLRVLVEETRVEVPGLNVGLTGEPVLDHDEMAQSQKDTTVASIAALIICALIFIYGYQETGRPVKATVCLLVGLAYTLAFAFMPWPVGHLNILTITFVPILIGLAIDYGVHLISRYEEELRHGKSEEAALTKAMVFTGQGIFTGAFTTAGAFLAMVFTNFKGIQEMGLICGFGLLVCFVPMMTMLPALLLRGRQNVLDPVQPGLDERRARIENLWLERPVLTISLTLLLCALAATQIHKVHFDYNLLHMQSEGLPAVEFEQKLIDSTPKSVLYAAVIATNLEHAVALEQQLTNLPAVASVDSITKFLAEDQTRKLRLVGDIKRDLAAICFPAADYAPANLTELSTTLYFLYGYLGNVTNELQGDIEIAAQEVVGHALDSISARPKGAFGPVRPKSAASVSTWCPSWDDFWDDYAQSSDLAAQLSSLRLAVAGLRKEMLRGDETQLETKSLKLAAFQRAFFDDVRDTFQALQTQDDRAPLRVEDLPQALHDRFVGVTGKYLLMVNPKEDVWKRENQRVFIEQLQQVDPNVTGTPIQLYYYTELLKSSYVEAAQYSLIAIVVLILFHFRSLWSVLLALLPVAVGSLWLAGLMGLCDVPLNPANIMTLPLVIGIGVTNGIHILNRFAEEQTPSIFARSTGKAVLVSGLTTIAGFGSLALGKHRGIQSLGYVMAAGLATCMLAGLVFLPALLNLLTRRRRKPSIEETTQCRQCMIDTGSGGTEAKKPQV